MPKSFFGLVIACGVIVSGMFAGVRFIGAPFWQEWMTFAFVFFCLVAGIGALASFFQEVIFSPTQRRREELV